MTDTVWHYRAWRALVVLLTGAGMEENQAIECAFKETQPMVADRTEWPTPEDAGQAAYEAMADAR